VLIVDDDGDSREMYTVALSVMGFQPVTAANAEDGFAQACDVHPDAIVTDITLPDVSGLDLTRRLRRDARTADTGIIVLTGHASMSILLHAQDAGCDRFLVKPCLPDTLAVEIRGVLATRQHPVRVDVSDGGAAATGAAITG
jgi:DNA-binding response OmpR family regulator